MLKTPRFLWHGCPRFGRLFEVRARKQSGFVACPVCVWWVREMGGRRCREVSPWLLPTVLGVVYWLEAAGGMAEEVSVWDDAD